jgi:hypothetical protein
MFRVAIGEYEVCCQADGLPNMLTEYQRHASLAEDFGLADDSGSADCFVSVGRVLEWPTLVVTQRYAPSGSGFIPGALVVPEERMLFIGAGRRLLAYDLLGPARLWEDQAECGFWSWSRHGSTVFMAAELELAAWDVSGRKLWSRFVEPPWHFSVADETVTVDVMGSLSNVHVRTGKPADA